MCGFIKDLLGAKEQPKVVTPAAAVGNATGAEKSGTLIGEGAQSSAQENISGTGAKKKTKGGGSIVGLGI